jgi:hypothetical protein
MAETGALPNEVREYGDLEVEVPPDAMAGLSADWWLVID